MRLRRSKLEPPSRAEEEPPPFLCSYGGARWLRIVPRLRVDGVAEEDWFELRGAQLSSAALKTFLRERRPPPPRVPTGAAGALLELMGAPRM